MDIMQCPRDDFQAEGAERNRLRSQELLLGCLGPESLPPDTRRPLARTGWPVAHEGVRVVGVSVGTEDLQPCLVRNTMGQDSASQERPLLSLEGAQASFQAFRLLYAVVRVPSPLTTLPPDATR